MAYRQVLFFALVLTPGLLSADMQMSVGPESLLSDVSITVDGVQTTSHSDIDVASIAEIDFGDTDKVVLRETNVACCISYDFLGIPIPRAWWVSIEHDGQLDYLCDRNNVVFELPKLLVTLSKSSSGFTALIEPERYCEEGNRIKSDLYEPSYWQSKEITIK